jgi:beta-glucosidase
MAQATFHFPRGFLWGTATSSHQVEGNNTNNNWWAWEQQPGRIKDGRKSGPACDWWGGRWRDDLDRAAETGQNAHRLSIEWSRIQPLPDKWDESALDRYREIARGLLERNMTPLVTLHHFSDPVWLAEKGGWESGASAEAFVTYVRKAVEALKEYVSTWITINEPNVLTAFTYIFGYFPPGKMGLNLARQAATNLVRAHAGAYHAIHDIQPNARVGVAHHYRPILPARSWSPLDRWASGMQSGLFNDLFARALVDGKVRFPLPWRARVPEARNTQDFIGLNYYTQDQASFNLLKPGELFARRFYPRDAELSETGLIANIPQGMFRALQWAKQFNLPILITENGVEDGRDHLRPRYLIQHLHQVWRAVNFNYPVKGYFYWTLVDNFEWERGWSQRFGLWELDVDSQTRSKRPSADLYAEICRENGISSEMVARYAPEIFEQMFPN